MTAGQHKAMITLHRKMVELGYRPDVASRMIQRAADRLLGAGDGVGGLGKVHQARRVRRDLDPSIAPRPVISGERCTTLQVFPGREEQLNIDIDEYRGRGWTVMKVSPHRGHEIWYACPPGQLPRENQPLVFSAEVG